MLVVTFWHGRTAACASKLTVSTIQKLSLHANVFRILKTGWIGKVVYDTIPKSDLKDYRIPNLHKKKKFPSWELFLFAILKDFSTNN